MSDPTVNAATGQPCKGKLAAQALAALVLDPCLHGTLQRLGLLAQVETALVPFGWPNREALAHKLGLTKTWSEEEGSMERSYYNVVVDYNTKAELGAASYEMREKFEEALKEGKPYIEVYISCVKHRVVVVRKEITKATPKAAHVITTVKVRESDVRASGEIVADQKTESSTDARWPHCHCPTPTLWEARRMDGRWIMAPGEPELEQRTCLACGATKSREIGR